MVITRLQRAALCVQWAPNGKKFAIGSGTNNCCVCSYEEENKWWAGKVIRKAHSSSVVCLAWHPDNMKLATGSTDGYCKVFYADKPGKQFSTCSRCGCKNSCPCCRHFECLRIWQILCRWQSNREPPVWYTSRIYKLAMLGELHQLGSLGYVHCSSRP